MVDEYELKYGPVDDRSIFNGEIIVPQHLKNQINSRSTRIHGGLLGSLNRSRTFLNLPTNLNSRESLIHGSVPDLSRSLPNTPNTNHKSQPDFSIENIDEDQKVVSNLKLSFNGRVKQMAAGSSKNLRRGSDDLPPTGHRNSKNNIIGTTGKMSTTNHHNRNNSEPNNKYVPIRAQIKKPTTIFEGISNRNSQNYDKTKRLSASLHNIHKLNQTEKIQEKIQSPSKWGDIRGSNAYSEGFSVGSLSTYTIPRASLNNQRINLEGTTSTSADILNDDDVGVDDSAA